MSDVTVRAEALDLSNTDLVLIYMPEGTTLEQVEPAVSKFLNSHRGSHPRLNALYVPAGFKVEAADDGIMARLGWVRR